MKVDLSKPFMALDGKTILVDQSNQPIIMGQYLADRIVVEESGESPMARYVLATKMYNTVGEMEIDEADLELIRKACKKTAVLFAAQILTIVNNAKN